MPTENRRAKFNKPQGLAVAPDGLVYVAREMAGKYGV
ncbi:MAG: hypothetical protein ACLU30_10950 [Odoribacter splanchnicus]